MKTLDFTTAPVRVHTLEDVLANPGLYDIVVNGYTSGQVISDGESLLDVNSNTEVTEEERWQIASFEEENNVTYIRH